NHFSFRVLRVGDCARIIVEHISGRSFDNSMTSNDPVAREKQVAETKMKIQAWWAEFQKKGEERMLIEATVAGNWDSVASAKMLQERYPQAALDALNKGIAAAKEPWVQRYLTEIAAKLNGDQVVISLRRQLKAETLMARVAAARALRERGINDGVRPMIEEW